MPWRRFRSRPNKPSTSQICRSRDVARMSPASVCGRSQEDRLILHLWIHLRQCSLSFQANRNRECNREYRMRAYCAQRCWLNNEYSSRGKSFSESERIQRSWIQPQYSSGISWLFFSSRANAVGRAYRLLMNAERLSCRDAWTTTKNPN